MDEAVVRIAQWKSSPYCSTDRCCNFSFRGGQEGHMGVRVELNDQGMDQRKATLAVPVRNPVRQVVL